MADWTLPWHYLAAIPCLLQNKTISGYDGKSYSLIQDLLDLPDDQLRAALSDQKGTGTADPPLFTHVRRIGATIKRPPFDWRDGNMHGATHGWWPKLDIRIRKMPEGFEGDIVLGPRALILPWPFPGDTEDRLKDRAELPTSQDGLGMTFDSLDVGSGADDLDPLTDFYASGFLHTLDRCLAGDLRSYFAPRRASDPKQAIMDKVPGLSIPDSLQVAHTDDGKMTTETWFEGSPDHIHVYPCWIEVNRDGTPKTSGESGPMRPMIYEWPCGVLQ